jgi:hypothetical protein
MRKLLVAVLCSIPVLCFCQPVFQLAPPLLKYASGFFSGKTKVEIVFNQPGAAVHYTINGNDPTERDPVYRKPVSIYKKTSFKAKAFGNEFLPSETVTANFISDGKAIEKIEYSKPNESYANAKPDILFDNVGGIVNYRSGGWLGYDNDTVTIFIDLKKKEKINSVLVDLLQDENSWIFLPRQLTLYYYNDFEKRFIPVLTENFNHEHAGPKQCVAHELTPASIRAQKLKLQFLPLKIIPGWHNGKGSHGWFFIDEIKVY